MKIIIVDISGKVITYDNFLTESIANSLKVGNVRLLFPGHGLLSLIPKKFKSSENVLKRLVKVAEALLNYVYITLLLMSSKVDVLHLQWLPFMEVNGWEIPILKIIKRISNRTKIVLTIHNVYPHDMSNKNKRAYTERFCKAAKYIDEFIVHTNRSKADVIQNFSLCPNTINVCCHGMFIPKGIVPHKTNREGGKLHVLMFGIHSYYKGTDILVDAINALNEDYNKKVEARIIGSINDKYLAELKRKDVNSRISWLPYYLENAVLYQEINNCDLIVLPYRAISQSGVLLLSMYFEKLIICSDLPSFKETMRGDEGNCLDSCLFFRNEDAGSLRELLEMYIDGNINEDAVRNRVNHLKSLYSWQSAANATLNVYSALNR